MNDFLLVLLIASVAGFLTYLGAPAAERFDVPQRVVSGALQLAAGIIIAIVGFSLMPVAVTGGPSWGVFLAFFVGGALYVFFEYYSARRLAAKPQSDTGPASLGLYFGVLVDVLIDGMVIGIGSSLTLATGFLLALGLAVSTAPLAFVTISTAKRQGMSRENRRLLSILFFVFFMAGALIGYVVLRNQSLDVRLILIALASGFLLTTVTQGMIPEANREGEPSFAGVFFVGGLALYALFTLYVK